MILFVFGIILLNVRAQLQADPRWEGLQSGDPKTVAKNIELLTQLSVVLILIGLLHLLIVLLVSMYKRIGLILAIIAYSIGLIWALAV